MLPHYVYSISRSGVAKSPLLCRCSSQELAGIVDPYFYLISTNNQAKRVIRHFTPVNIFWIN